MKIAVVSSIFGGIESFRPIPAQSVPFQAFFYTENNMNVPRWDFQPRLKAKFFKILAHQVSELQPFDLIVWLDGSFQVTSPEWLHLLISTLEEADLAVLPHHERGCIYEEVAFVQRMIKNGNGYLKKRYEREPLLEQATHYKSQGYPERGGLWSCGMFVRRNNAKLNNAFNEWWIENCKWSIQDQLSFPVIVKRHALNIKTVDVNIYRNPYFKWIEHA